MKALEGVDAKGVYRFTKALIETPAQQALHDTIVRLRDAGLPFRDLLDDLHRMCKTEVVVLENLVPTAGRAAIANNLTSASPSPSSILVNYVALGTGTTAPANGDTTLETETYRNAVASRTNSNNVGYITGFFSATETTGTFREAGLFIEGGAGADTGTLFSRIAINITKSGTESLTIDWTVTFS